MSPVASHWAARMRLEPTAWLLPASCFLGYLAATGVVEQSPGYPLAATIRGHGALIVLVPIAAACAAWKAGRYRRAGWTSRRWRRSPANVLVAESLGTALVQLAAHTVVVSAVTATSVAGTGSHRATLGAVALALLLGWASIGFLVGWMVRAEVAVPLVLVVSYAAEVFPDAMEPLWVRHLTGVHSGCCFQDAVLDGGAVRAPILLGLGATAAAAVALAATRRAALAAAVPVVLVGAAVAAVGQVDHLGPHPIAPRIGATVCAGAEPRVCLWPEQRDALAHVAPIARNVAERWRRAGLDVPATVSVRPGDAGPTSIVFAVPNHPSDDEVIAAFAQAAVPEIECADAPTELYEAREVAWGLLASLGGVPEGRLIDHLGEEQAAAVRSLRAGSASTDEAAAWVGAIAVASASCATSVPASPR